MLSIFMHQMQIQVQMLMQRQAPSSLTFCATISIEKHLSSFWYVQASASSSAFPQPVFAMLGDSLHKLAAEAIQDAAGPSGQTSSSPELTPGLTNTPYESPLLSFRSYRFASLQTFCK